MLAGQVTKTRSLGCAPHSAVLPYAVRRTPYCRTPYAIRRTPYAMRRADSVPYAVCRTPYAVLPYSRTAVRRTAVQPYCRTPYCRTPYAVCRTAVWAMGILRRLWSPGPQIVS